MGRIYKKKKEEELGIESRGQGGESFRQIEKSGERTQGNEEIKNSSVWLGCRVCWGNCKGWS